MAKLKGKTILLIDDAPDHRLLVQKILESDGANYLEAGDVATGLQFAQKSVPHLILTDLGMPGEDGFSFLEKKLAIPKLKKIPTIVISGNHQTEAVMRALALGASDYLLKPFRTTAILMKIRRTLFRRNFLSYRFEKPQKVEVTVSGNIRTASEIGFQIDAPVKLGPDAQVKLEGTLPNEMGCADLTLRTLQTGKFIAPNLYTNDLNLLGVNEQIAKLIRKTLKDAA